MVNMLRYSTVGVGVLIERGGFKGQRGERNGASLLHQRHLRLTGLSSLNLQLVATGSARHWLSAKCQCDTHWHTNTSTHTVLALPQSLHYWRAALLITAWRTHTQQERNSYTHLFYRHTSKSTETQVIRNQRDVIFYWQNHRQEETKQLANRLAVFPLVEFNHHTHTHTKQMHKHTQEKAQYGLRKHFKAS